MASKMFLSALAMAVVISPAHAFNPCHFSPGEMFSWGDAGHCTKEEVHASVMLLEFGDKKGFGGPPSCECGKAIIAGLQKKEDSTRCFGWGPDYHALRHYYVLYGIVATEVLPLLPPHYKSTYEYECAGQSISLPVFGMIAVIIGSLVAFFAMRRRSPITVEPLLG